MEYRVRCFICTDETAKSLLSCTFELQKKNIRKINAVEMRSFRRIYSVILADRIPKEDIHRTTGTTKNVTVRIKKNVLWLFGHAKRISDEGIANKIYEGKVSGKRGRVRPQLTFENIVSKILEGHVKILRTPQPAYIKRLITVDEAKEINNPA